MTELFNDIRRGFCLAIGRKHCACISAGTQGERIGTGLDQAHPPPPACENERLPKTDNPGTYHKYLRVFIIQWKTNLASLCTTFRDYPRTASNT